MQNSKPTAARERRRYARTPLEVDVQLVHDGQLVVSVSSDVSTGGISLRTGQLPTSAEIKLFLALPAVGGRKARLALFGGQVAWSTAERTGIRFASSTENESMTYLRSLLTRGPSADN